MSIVWLKVGKKEFEIACYPNKVKDWRNRIETDIDSVLQTREVFTNVTQGKKASKKDFQEAFDEKTKDEVILEILNKGNLQVSELEWESEHSKLKVDIANKIC